MVPEYLGLARGDPGEPALSHADDELLAGGDLDLQYARLDLRTGDLDGAMLEQSIGLGLG